MKQPFGSPQHKQFIPKPSPHEQVSSFVARHSSQHKQFIPKPGPPRNQTSMSDQATPSFGRTYDYAPLGVPNTPWPNQDIQEPADQVPMADQDMTPQAAYSFWPATPNRIRDAPPAVIRHLLRAGLVRLQEPQPEGLLTRGLQTIRQGSGLGLVPVLALTNTLGLLLISLAYYISALWYSYAKVEVCFFAGLLIMVVPNLVRLLSRKPTRIERIVLLCVLAGCCYFVQFMTSPLHFSGFDEFLHWRTADDILRTGHLFHENSMLPTSPYFPGLEMVTNAVSTLTGLSTFYAGNIVIVAARLFMILALFLFYEYITGSSRMASIAIIIYMANPHFFFFDTFYNYETLSLPFSILMMYILVRYGNTDKNYRWVISTAWVILLAITITHHMTDYFFDGLLFLWAGVNFFRPIPSISRIHLAAIATFGLFLALAYAFLLPGNPVWSYLSAYFGTVFNQLEQIIAGSSIARPLFASSSQVAPIWDRLLITAAIALTTFSLPFALLVLERQQRDNTLAITFGIVSLLYPFTQIFRFTSFGTEITDRAAAFLFLPIAYMLMMLITHFWPTHRLNWKTISLITSAIAVILVGGVTVGTGPDLIIVPGPYIVVADARSVEPQGIEAARWSLAYLGQDKRVATDRINQMLMNSYGHQRIVTYLNDNVDISPIFYSTQFDSKDIAILRGSQIHYLVVDTRISTALPLEGTYFENDRPKSIISRDVLTKFNTVTRINRLFDSGDIVIYDTGAFIGGSDH